MKRKSIWGLAMLLLCFAMTICGCASQGEANDTTASTTAAPSSVVTEPATEPATVYKKQTVYLCTLETMKQYENGYVSKSANSYDEYGRIAESWAVMDDGSMGTVTTYFYDESGNNVEQRSGDGRYEMTYDSAGRMLSKLWYSGEECKSEYYYTYDDAGHPMEEVRITRYSEENTVTYTRNYNEDFTEAVIDKVENGENTGYTLETYNAEGLILTSNSYDVNDTWRSGSAYEYDDAGRLVVEWRYSSSETQADYDIIYTYDENSLLVTKNVDYYYGYLMTYTYEPFEILVPVE